MRFLLKMVPIGIGLILILAGVVLLFLATQLTRSTRSAIERGLSAIYLTEVRVENVTITLSQSAMDVDGVTIFNPEPFTEGPAIEVDHVHVEFVPSTLLSRTTVLRSVTLRDATVHLRLEAGRGTNLSQLDANATRLLGGSSSGAPVTARRKFVIQQFQSESARVEFSSNVLPVSSVGFDVQPFTMNELSSTEPVSAIDVCVLFVRNVLHEGISLRGVLGPVADRLRAEFGRSDATSADLFENALESGRVE